VLQHNWRTDLKNDCDCIGLIILFDTVRIAFGHFDESPKTFAITHFYLFIHLFIYILLINRIWSIIARKY